MEEVEAIIAEKKAQKEKLQVQYELDYYLEVLFIIDAAKGIMDVQTEIAK